jgi:hypothetical protein
MKAEEGKRQREAKDKGRPLEEAPLKLGKHTEKKG